MDHPPRCRGPERISRREMLQVGGAGLLGLSLPGLLRAEAEAGEGRAGPSPRADACIVVFLNGGPSHLDMWDMKPKAPVEIRGEFRPIATSVPGVLVSEHLPRLAGLMHHGTLIRSAHHSVNNAHAAAVYVGLTGHDRGDATVAIGTGPNDYPAIGSVIGLCRPPRAPVVSFVSMPYVTAEGPGGPPQPGFFGGWLGRDADPLFVLKDPNAPGFGMPELGLPADVSPARFGGRRRLVGDLDGAMMGAGRDRRLRDMDGFQARAFDLITSPDTRRAFQLDREHPRVRDAYGRNIYGQSVLLARRLIEAGTRVACISWAPDANATWDTHGKNFVRLKSELLPQLDAALSSLLGDLEARGRLDSDARGGHGRVRPQPEGQPPGGPRTLEPLLQPLPGRRRDQARPRPRLQRRHRRPPQQPPGHPGRDRRHDLPMPGHPRRPRAARSPATPLRARPLGPPHRGRPGLRPERPWHYAVPSASMISRIVRSSSGRPPKLMPNACNFSVTI